MGLIVLALRCYLVFQNIFITFKTLKQPPPSSRNNGKPSVRALTQRKRDMKGCMAIWVVWCSFATYEANVERLVSIFIPFYDEVKSVVLVFFILSRARSAEPIYLHIIRPLIKPYVSTIDSILDFTHNISDFILLVLSLPVHAVLSWWHGSRSDDGQTVLTEVDADSLRSYGDDRLAASPAWSDVSIPPDDQDPARPDIRSRDNARRPVDTGRAVDRFYASSGPSSSESRQIWHPPASSYDDEEEHMSTLAASGSTYNPVMTMPEPQIPALRSEAGMVDEWRLYPPFPSAYPPTPIRPSAGIAMPAPVHPAQFAVIPEHGDPNLDQPGPDTLSRPIQNTEQGFGQSLLSPRELPNPGSDGDLSDDISMSGVQDNETRYIVSDDNDDDEDQDDYETEEDDFDVTLRTPYKLRSQRAVPMDRAASNVSIATAATAASSDPSISIQSDSARLSTVDCASTLRTRTASPSIGLSTSDSSSMAGRKRPLPRSRQDPHSRVRTVDRVVRSPRRGATNATRSRVPISRSTSLQVNAEGTTSEETLDEDDGDVGQTDSSPNHDVPVSLAQKRRRVAVTPRAKGSVRARPVPRSPRTANGKDEPRDRKGTTTRAKLRPVATRTSLRTINARMTAAPPSRPPSVSSTRIPTNKRPSFVEQGSRPVRGREVTKKTAVGK